MCSIFCAGTALISQGPTSSAIGAVVSAFLLWSNFLFPVCRCRCCPGCRSPRGTSVEGARNRTLWPKSKVLSERQESIFIHNKSRHPHANVNYIPENSTCRQTNRSLKYGNVRGRKQLRGNKTLFADSYSKPGTALPRCCLQPGQLPHSVKLVQISYLIGCWCALSLFLF